LYPLPVARVVILAHFLDALEERMLFLIKAILVNGGSKFEAAFEKSAGREISGCLYFHIIHQVKCPYGAKTHY
jgi:hypothetical protein